MFPRIEYFDWLRDHRDPAFDLASTDLLIEPPHLDAARGKLGTHAPGADSLESVLAAEFGVDVGQVLVTAGGTHANFIAIATALDTGDRVLVEQPGYEPLVTTARGFGAGVDRFTRSPPTYGIPVDEITHTATPDHALAAVTNRHNPSGHRADPDTITAVARDLKDNEARLLIDEVYAPYGRGERTGIGYGELSVASRENTIVTGSLSKFFGLRGLRVGWLIADTPFVDRARVVLDHVSGVSDPSIHLAHQVLTAPEALVTNALDRVTRNADLLTEFIASRRDLECTVPSHCTFTFPAHTTADGDAVAVAAWEDGVLIIPGRLFGDRSRFRLSAGTDPDTAAAGFDKFAGVLDSL